MNTRAFNKWLKALRSDEFEQTTSELVDELSPDGCYIDEFGMPIEFGDNITPRAIGYCCLGVAAEVLDVDSGTPWDQLSLAPKELIDALGIPIKMEEEHPPTRSTVFDITVKGGRTNVTASSMNDSGKSFKTIARWLEKNKDKLIAVYS